MACFISKVWLQGGWVQNGQFLDYVIFEWSQRLRKRHGDGDAAEAQTEMCMKIGSFYELKATGEENTFDIIITKDMTLDDVAQKIMDVVNGL